MHRRLDILVDDTSSSRGHSNISTTRMIDVLSHRHDQLAGNQR